MNHMNPRSKCIVIDFSFFAPNLGRQRQVCSNTALLIAVERHGTRLRHHGGHTRTSEWPDGALKSQPVQSWLLGTWWGRSYAWYGFRASDPSHCPAGRHAKNRWDFYIFWLVWADALFSSVRTIQSMPSLMYTDFLRLSWTQMFLILEVDTQHNDCLIWTALII